MYIICLVILYLFSHNHTLASIDQRIQLHIKLRCTFHVQYSVLSSVCTIVHVFDMLYIQNVLRCEICVLLVYLQPVHTGYMLDSCRI